MVPFHSSLMLAVLPRNLLFLIDYCEHLILILITEQFLRKDASDLSTIDSAQVESGSLEYLTCQSCFRSLHNYYCDALLRGRVSAAFVDNGKKTRRFP